ncbi:40S ribosomal protein S17 [Diaporthe sp. PMI_573]|nr:40S ribosomal protein S17 [Diaporthaceae sp. PMI_573]
MGRVRTKTVKKSSKVIIERFYPKLTLDFETNKRIIDEVRKDQFVPEVSALDFTQNSESGQLDVDAETKDLLKHLGVSLRHHFLLILAPEETGGAVVCEC